MRSRDHAKRPVLVEDDPDCAEAAAVAFAEQLEVAATEPLREAVRCRQVRGVVSWVQNRCHCLACQAETVHHLTACRQKPEGLLRYAERRGR
jgi:hypothetical protein